MVEVCWRRKRTLEAWEACLCHAALGVASPSLTGEVTLSNIHIFTLMLISAFIFHLFMSSDTNTDADIHWTRFLLTVLDKQWHTECVRCHTCGDLLDHKCFFRSRLPLFKLIISPYQGCAPPGKRAAPPWQKSGGKIDLNSEP